MLIRSVFWVQGSEGGIATYIASHGLAPDKAASEFQFARQRIATTVQAIVDEKPHLPRLMVHTMVTDLVYQNLTGARA